jgi:hypothetical protein
MTRPLGATQARHSLNAPLDDFREKDFQMNEEIEIMSFNLCDRSQPVRSFGSSLLKKHADFNAFVRLFEKRSRRHSNERRSTAFQEGVDDGTIPREEDVSSEPCFDVVDPAETLHLFAGDRRMSASGGKRFRGREPITYRFGRRRSRRLKTTKNVKCSRR